MSLNQPHRVVLLTPVVERQPQLLDVSEGPQPQQLLLQRADEALDAAVALRCAHEGRARLDSEEGQLLLEGVAHVLAAVVVTKLEAGRHLCTDGTEALAPDMNPDEHVWGYRKNMFRRTPLEERETLVDAVDNSMRTIAEDKKIVRGFFGHPEVSYVMKALRW